jgi:glycosyltransferase involved in cell wall biosynthesis
VTRRVLVVTTVHHPDDNRIREKTIRALGERFQVDFAAREPGPSDSTGLTWIPLRGGRVRRNLAAWRLVLTGPADVVSIHDPELLPLGVVARVIRRRPVVFDMHEDVPNQILTKAWIPAVLRPLVSAMSRLVLRMSERVLTFTLAEDSYSRQLRSTHPVIANHPEVDSLPRVRAGRNGMIYVGSVSEERGLLDAVRAGASVGVPLTVVGPVADELALRMRREAAEGGGTVNLTGRLPHREAMEMVAASAVALSPLHDLPNYRHSIPTKVLEYLAIGVPVAASDLPATRAVTEGLQAVFLHRPGDVDSLVTAVRQALSPEIAAVAEGQVDAVRARFRWPAQQLVALYDDLCR